MNKFGIDISEHNGNVDMNRIKASGVEFVMIRSSWGHFAEDAQVRNNVAKCKQVGMPFGLYHYSYAESDTSARTEATSFLALCRELGGATYPLNLDMEDADGWKSRNGVGDEQNIRTIQIFKEVLEGAGEYISLYMSKSWFDRLRNVNAAVVNSLDPWLAHWGILAPSMDCGMWQYSSDGVIDGSNSRTDVNYAYKDYPAIITSMKNGTVNPAPTPEPTPDPTPTPPIESSFSVGTAVRVKQDATDYKGGRLSTFVYNTTYSIIEIVGDRVVIGLNNKVTAAININDLYTASSQTVLSVGNNVRVSQGAKDYNGVGLSNFVYNNTYAIIEIKGDRVVIGINGTVTAAMNINNVYKV